MGNRRYEIMFCVSFVLRFSWVPGPWAHRSQPEPHLRPGLMVTNIGDSANSRDTGHRPEKYRLYAFKFANLRPAKCQHA